MVIDKSLIADAQAGNEEAIYDLAITYIEIQDFESASVWANKLYQVAPGDGSYLLGLIAEEQGDEDLALDWFTKGTNLESVQCMVGTAIILFEKESSEAALDIALKAYDLGSRAAAILISDYYLEMEKFEQCMIWSNRVLELTKDELQDEDDIEVYTDALYSLAISSFHLGDTKRARSLHQEAAELGHVRSGLELSITLLEEMRLAEAEHFIKIGIKANDPFAISLMGDLELKRDNRVACLENWKIAIEQEEYNLIKSFFFQLQQLQFRDLISTGEKSAASQGFEQWFDTFLDTHQHIEDVREIISIKKSVQVETTRLESQPKKKTNIELGDEAAWKEKDKVKAETYWLLAGKNGDPRAMYRLGIIDLFKGNYAEAIQRWAEISHRSPAICAAIAGFYIDEGNHELAFDWHRRAQQDGWDLPICGLSSLGPIGYLLSWVDLSFGPVFTPSPTKWSETFSQEVIEVVAEKERTQGRSGIAELWDALKQ